MCCLHNFARKVVFADAFDCIVAYILLTFRTYSFAMPFEGASGLLFDMTMGNCAAMIAPESVMQRGLKKGPAPAPSQVWHPESAHPWHALESHLLQESR